MPRVIDGDSIDIGECSGITYYKGQTILPVNGDSIRFGPIVTTRSMVTIVGSGIPMYYVYSIYFESGIYKSRLLSIIQSTTGSATVSLVGTASGIELNVRRAPSGGGTIDWLIKIEPF